MIQNHDASEHPARASTLWRYGIAVLAVLVGTALRLLLDPILPHGVPFLISLLAIAGASRFGGTASGIAATFLSIPPAIYFFVGPRYSFRVSDPQDWTALGIFAVVGICLSFFAGRSQPGQPFSASADRSLARRVVLLGAACLLLFGLSRFLYSDFQRDRDGQLWVANTYQVLNASKTLFSTLQDAETAARGYLLTGEDRYLSQFRAALAGEPAVQQRLRRLTADNPAQQSRMDVLDGLIAARLGILAHAVESNVDGAALIRSGEGTRYMNEIRNILAAAQAEEQRLLIERTAAAEAEGSRMRWVLGLGSGSLLLLLLFAAVVIESDFRERERARRILHDQQEALKQSEDATRALVEAASLAIVGVHADGKIAVVNGMTERIFGFTREEAIGQQLEILLPGKLRLPHRAHLGEFIAAPESRSMGLDMNLTGRRKDGSEFPIEVGLGSVRTLSGPLFVSYITDITDRQRASQALLKSEQDMRRYLEFAPAAIATFDSEMRYLAVSRRYREDYGLADETEILGRSHYEIFPEIPEHWRAIHRRCLAGAVERSDGERFLRMDGSEQWIRWEIQPWHQGDGSVGGIVLFTEEITRQKLAEEEIRSLNASLELRVERRTAQLEAANRELEAFSYSVSHDLRAPLRGIDGWSLALLEDYGGALDEKARRYIGRVRSETVRLGRLIDEMLRLSHVTRAEMRHEEVDLSALVDSIAARLREGAPERELEIVVEAGLTAAGDAHLLEIALTNLLENAVKFTGPCPVARIEFGHRQLPGETAFYVRDNGVGFDMAFAGTLFGAFQRMHRENEFPGSGIGLATVQRVIHRHGGRVWAEALPQKGATFYFTIGGAG